MFPCPQFSSIPVSRENHAYFLGSLILFFLPFASSSGLSQNHPGRQTGQTNLPSKLEHILNMQLLAP